MEKQQILSFIGEQLTAGKISKEDLRNITDGTLKTAARTEPSKNLITIFYGIGAIIAIAGIGILVQQHWDEIGFLGRITVTLGISLAAYIVAFLLNKPEQKTLSQVIFTISAAVAPLGTYILLKKAGIDFNSITQIGTASALLIIFGTALIINKKNILIIITIGFATWAYYAAIMQIFGFSSNNGNLMEWATILLGVSYILISYGYPATLESTDTADMKEKKAVQNVLYGFGTLAILAAGISIGGLFDIVFIGIIFGAFYGSVYLKSRSMLIFAALFLIAHIIKLTSKYFVGSIGWPVTLIFIGFLIIGIGYMTYFLNKKFISSK